MKTTLEAVVKPVSLALWLALQGAGAAAQAPAPLPPVAVYAPKPCPGCADWIKQLRQGGFVVTLEEKPALVMQRTKRWLNVPSALEAVQTAQVGAYFIEGSVPPQDIKRLLIELPLARGLGLSPLPGSVPGREKFNTLLVGPDGQTTVYAQH
jgi:hypothetical protein